MIKKRNLFHLKEDIRSFGRILKERGYFWDINQHHVYFKYNLEFNSRQIKSCWNSFIKTQQNNSIIRNNIDCYIHIPFCRSKCVYCAFPSWQAKNEKELVTYVDFVVRQMKFFSSTFRTGRLHNLYIGGGTPSILNRYELKRLLSELFKEYSFFKRSQKTSECNPHSARIENFYLLRDFGFNRISFGVQSLHPKTLKVNKRQYQEFAKIHQALKLAKKAGFKDINIDLMVGLAGDSLGNFKKSFTEIAKLKPYNIVVYGLMPPNQHYLKYFLKMEPKEYFMKYYPSLISGAIKIMSSLAKQFDYIPDTLEPSRWHWGFRHKDHLEPDVSSTYSGEYAGCTLGFGSFARSHIHGMLEYRQNKYVTEFTPEAPLYEGKVFNTKEEVLKFIINRIDRESSIPLELFKSTFGLRFTELFPYSLASLRLLNKISIHKDRIFFKFNKPEDKYINVLFFFKEFGVV